MTVAFRTVAWDGVAVELLDQTLLPNEERTVRCETVEQLAEAIRRLVVRGAPAIGVAAAYGVALAARLHAGAGNALEARVLEASTLLRGTRPTAVNLFWALDRMEAVLRASAGQPVAARVAALDAEARAVHAEDAAMCEAIGSHGAALLGDDVTLLTHCNTGALATGGIGTALGIVRSAVASGRRVRVLADETRPLLQGARLTAWELQRDGIDVTLITDSMAGHFLRTRQIAAVLVGADRIAANGDTANKIGTYSVAVLARENGVPFYVAAPTSTIDLSIASGEQIPIEERAADEVRAFHGSVSAPGGVAVANPAFDVTPARYVTAIVTEAGVCRPPFEQSLRAACEGALAGMAE